jgi:hypothetical protein
MSTGPVQFGDGKDLSHSRSWIGKIDRIEIMVTCSGGLMNCQAANAKNRTGQDENEDDVSRV